MTCGPVATTTGIAHTRVRNTFSYSTIPRICRSGGGAIGVRDSIRTYVASTENLQVIWNDCGKMIISSPDSVSTTLWSRAPRIAADPEELGVQVGFMGAMQRTRNMISYREKTSVTLLGPALQLRPGVPISRIDSLVAVLVGPDVPSPRGSMSHGVLVLQLPQAIGKGIFSVVDGLLQSGMIVSFGYDPGRVCVYAD